MNPMKTKKARRHRFVFFPKESQKVILEALTLEANPEDPDRVETEFSIIIRRAHRARQSSSRSEEDLAPMREGARRLNEKDRAPVFGLGARLPYYP